MRALVQSPACHALFEVTAFVAFAYVVGGVVLAIRLYRAGVPSGSDVLTLFPSQQVLATGVAALLVSLALPLVLAAFFFLVESLGRLIGALFVHLSPSRTHKATKRKSRLGLRVAIMLLTLGLISSQIWDPSLGTLGGSRDGAHLDAFAWVVVLALAALAAWLMVRPAFEPGKPPPTDLSFIAAVLKSPQSLLPVVLTILAITTVAAYAGPTRLSIVTVTTANELCVSGPFVSQNGTAISMADGVDHSILVIDTKSARSTTIYREKVNAATSRVVSGDCPAVGKRPQLGRRLQPDHKQRS